MRIRLFKNKVYIYNSFLFITASLYFKKGSSVKCVDVCRIALTGRTEVLIKQITQLKLSTICPIITL